MGRIITSLSRVAAVVSLTIYMSGCSVTETVSNFLSSTTPGDWYTSDGLPKAEHKLDVFLATNLNNVKMDAARGSGEYLQSLGRLLDVDAAGQPKFAALVQEQYPLLADQDGTVIAGMVTAAAQKVR
jgi:hypothetical protein